MPYRYGSKSSRNPCKHWLGTLSRLKRPLVAGGSASRQRNVNHVNHVNPNVNPPTVPKPQCLCGLLHCCTCCTLKSALAGGEDSEKQKFGKQKAEIGKGRKAMGGYRGYETLREFDQIRPDSTRFEWIRPKSLQVPGSGI
jgi:hypothetical protein